MKFILSRTDDWKDHSKKWIVGYGILFWLVSRIFAMLLVIGCTAVYNLSGISPDSLTSFGGNPEVAKNIGSMVYVLLTVGIVAPLLEECIFRLGLSFKKWQIATAIAAIPAYILWQQFSALTLCSVSVYISLTIALFCLIYFMTPDSFWRSQKAKHYKSYVWATAIIFGFIHLIAFSNYDFRLVPYMLCVITVPFFAGCAITYYRINLGFWWGVALHVFNNLPGVFMILSA